MTNQYALGYKAGLEAAVKVCREKAVLFRNTTGECIKTIEALPAPEVQWVDLTMDDYIELSGQGRFYVNDPESGTCQFLDHEFTKAAIELFKEKQNVK